MHELYHITLLACPTLVLILWLLYNSEPNWCDWIAVLNMECP